MKGGGLAYRSAGACPPRSFGETDASRVARDRPSPYDKTAARSGSGAPELQSPVLNLANRGNRDNPASDDWHGEGQALALR